LYALAVLSFSSARVLRASPQRHLQQFGYVPQGCQGLTVQVSGNYGFDRWNNPIVYGTVTLSNPNQFDMPISSVKVQVNNNVPVAPLFTTANCASNVVPANPEPYQLGTTTCSYQVSLPTNGIAAGFSSWPSVMATAAIGMSNAQCSSGLTYISSQPFVYDSNTAAAGSTLGATAFSTTPSTLGSDSSNNNGKRKLLDAGIYGFVPSGCQGLTLEASGYTVPLLNRVVGTVTLKNPATFSIPIQQVQVTLANSVGMPPLSATATCLGGQVPSSPVPYTTGELLCAWEVRLPESGPASNAAAWTSLKATAAIGMSGATCDSNISKIYAFGR
jgi:hypothetical protein